VPLDLSQLLARPAAALRALRAAPAEASARVTGLDLSLVAGRAGAPEGIAGIVDAHAGLSGSLDAPRGRATVEVSHGAWIGYRAIAGHVDLALGKGEVASSGRIAVAGEEALRFTASLGAPLERLDSTVAIRRAPLRAEAVIPSLALARATGQEVPLTGVVKGRLTVSGTPGAPEATLDLAGGGVAIEGRPLGEASLRASYSGGRGSAELRLRPTSGGELRATLAVEAALGLGAGGPRLRDAPAEASIFADALDLGFLPAVAPGVVRTASGKVHADLRARGPLSRLSPRGTLHAADAALAITELGEWTGIAVDVSVTADAIELSRLEVRRGKGRLSANGALRGIRSGRAALDAHLSSDAFTFTRAGMEVATIDVRIDATGSYAARTLTVDAHIPRGVVRLPNRAPRTLQSLDKRRDIVVTTRERRRAGSRAPPSGGRPEGRSGGDVAEEPLTIVVHAIAPKELFVRSEDPKVDVELKADVTYERSGMGEYAKGAVEVVRGTVDPIAGRTFVVQRGRVQFTDGPPGAAMLEVEATYDNPVAKVTVDVAGPLGKPEIRLSSQPPLDDSQIAMLIATGQTTLKPGAGGVGTLSGEEAGKAALAVLATQAFKNLVANKLPLDTVALDSGALRAGKYVTDRIYVGYTRKFDADETKGENVDEVRVEYQISPRWTFESRYGNAQSGGASLVWSRSY
jgi:translocation and assembly module TamB